MVLAEQDINVIYSRTKLLLVPSLWSEAYGLVTVEAQVRGIPVISTDKLGLPEANLGPRELVIPVRDRLHFDHARCLWFRGAKEIGDYTVSYPEDFDVVEKRKNYHVC